MEVKYASSFCRLLSALLTTFLMISHVTNVSMARSTLKAMAKGQIACTMCSSCDNPCHPYFPPPPPPLYPPPPPPISYCPPRPPIPPPVCDFPPPPPVGIPYYSPPPPPPISYGGPSSGSGSYYPPPSDPGIYPVEAPPPPKPFDPNFPYSYLSPPPLSAMSSSVPFAMVCRRLVLGLIFSLFSVL